MNARARIARTQIASLAFMVAVVVLVTAKSSLIRWLAIGAMVLYVLGVAVYFLHLYRQRQRQRHV